MIAIDKLCKAFGGKAVLQDFSCELEEGRVTALMAPSGAGKTTLLRILLGLERADGGEVAPKDLRWAAVFQEDRLLEGLDAAGNLRFALGAAYDDSQAKALLGALGLGDVGEKKARDYSGGMKRRLALTRALLAPCDALALDEPFTGLDAGNREAALTCILRAAKEKIVLLAAHEALALPARCGEVRL